MVLMYTYPSDETENTEGEEQKLDVWPSFFHRPQRLAVQQPSPPVILSARNSLRTPWHSTVIGDTHASVLPFALGHAHTYRRLER